MFLQSDIQLKFWQTKTFIAVLNISFINIYNPNKNKNKILKNVPCLFRRQRFTLLTNRMLLVQLNDTFIQFCRQSQRSQMWLNGMWKILQRPFGQCDSFGGNKSTSCILQCIVVLRPFQHVVFWFIGKQKTTLSVQSLCQLTHSNIN